MILLFEIQKSLLSVLDITLKTQNVFNIHNIFFKLLNISCKVYTGIYHIYLMVSASVWMSWSMVRYAERGALRRYPHDPLSIVIQFSHLCFWRVPDKQTNYISQHISTQLVWPSGQEQMDGRILHFCLSTRLQNFPIGVNVNLLSNYKKTGPAKIVYTYC